MDFNTNLLSCSNNRDREQIRVAAYVRSLPGKDLMLHDLVQQISGYSEKILKTKGWTFAGVYADNSGHSEYQQMMSDCEKGLVDLILVQSISTFGLRPFQLAEAVEKLAGFGVGVVFENEGIDTVTSVPKSSSEDKNRDLVEHPILSEDGSVMLSVFNSFAKKADVPQDSASQRIYGFDEKGKPTESEANVIRTIFDLFLTGFGRMPIAQILNDEGIVPPNRKTAWTYVDIKRILSEQAYRGAIIDEETYEKAGRENQRRTVAYGYRTPADSLLASRITCGICGNTFTRRERGKGSIWLCRTYLKKGKTACQSRCIRERVLMGFIAELPGGIESVENISVYPDGRLIITADDEDHEKVWRSAVSVPAE